MKRSKSIKLVVMATTSVTLASCSDEPDLEGRVYKTEEECVTDSFVPDEVCTQVISAGKQIHQTSGPRYNTVNLCDEQHGNNSCLYESASGSDFYSPQPSGYFVTGALAGLTGAVASQALMNNVRPVYPERGSRRYYTSGGYYVGSYGGGSWRTYNDAVKTPPKAARVQTRTSVASRGGFGSRSSSGSRGG
ncbi:DUF1190 domain-containing protein [uncultured Roseibium sp.]|uniref:DUF1190 domain-containing protein n=1 Tax=uncultured Roseibium sp. TaxID=1936171 RepID=UPI00262A6264|nr:DUF1190 domain-containing protein [uncultured Roseibium sp.]